MTIPATDPRQAAPSLIAGRYVLYHEGAECGEERWRIEGAADGMVLTGEQQTAAPHPFPNHHAYRVSLSREWRITGLEILWTVGSRTVRATHGADGEMWRVRIEYDGHAREQECDAESPRRTCAHDGDSAGRTESEVTVAADRETVLLKATASMRSLPLASSRP